MSNGTRPESSIPPAMSRRKQRPLELLVLQKGFTMRFPGFWFSTALAKIDGAPVPARHLCLKNVCALLDGVLI